MLENEFLEDEMQGKLQIDWLCFTTPGKVQGAGAKARLAGSARSRERLDLGSFGLYISQPLQSIKIAYLSKKEG